VLISREHEQRHIRDLRDPGPEAGQAHVQGEYVGSNGAIRQRVLATPAAIGYVGLAFTEGVKALTVNKIAASEETVSAKTYPIARPLFMYTDGRPKAGSALSDFVTLAAKPEGKRIVRDTGFVPLPDEQK